jgi:FAD/FMN-containing dehydrogenase
MKDVVKAGGHSNSNTIENGIAIDLTSFNQIKVDTCQQRVTVQPGALGSKLIEAVSKQTSSSGSSRGFHVQIFESPSLHTPRLSAHLLVRRKT